MKKPISFHYTNEKMVKDLLKLTPFKKGELALDAGSGKNKVWQKNCPIECLECEIEDGVDFLTQWDYPVDWVIGNPPFHLGWKFLEKASDVATTGIAFLGNLNFWNSCLPNRLEKLKAKGFYINNIHIVQDKRWFGRYYYIIFTKKENNFISWNKETYI